MAKVKFKNSDGHKLSGVIYKSQNHKSDNYYVVMVHGFTGDKDEKGLFVDAQNFFTKKGFSVFRFDMRGCGESEGDFREVSLEDEKNDLVSAINFLKEKESLRDENIFLLGFSLGATVSALGYEEFPHIKALAFWSPAFFPSDDMYPRYQTTEIRNELSNNGYFIKSGIKVGPKILNSLRTCDLVPALERIYRPTLILHGERDDKISFRSSERAASSCLYGKATFGIINHACHSFRKPKKAREKLFSRTLSFFESQRENRIQKKRLLNESVR